MHSQEIQIELRDAADCRLNRGADVEKLHVQKNALAVMLFKLIGECQAAAGQHAQPDFVETDAVAQLFGQCQTVKHIWHIQCHDQPVIRCLCHGASRLAVSTRVPNGCDNVNHLRLGTMRRYHRFVADEHDMRMQRMTQYDESHSTGQNPVYIGAGLFAGVALLIAVVIALTEGPGAAQVGAAESNEPMAEAVTQSNSDVADGITAVELSGDAVSPEDTNALTTPVAGGDEDTQAGADTAERTTDLVNDPDNGAKQGDNPDGGAGSFYPTPSGPEGRDGETALSD